jgi:hypothetical protein
VSTPKVAAAAVNTVAMNVGSILARRPAYDAVRRAALQLNTVILTIVLIHFSFFCGSAIVLSECD